MLVYDSPHSMVTNINQWIYEINEHVMEPARLVLVRTKTDATPITPEEQACAEEMVEKYSMEMFVGVSSKDNVGVAEVNMKI